MKGKTNTFHFIGNVYKEKCPNCNKGQVFNNKLPFYYIPVMNEFCLECHYKFEREPGYFIGAMYISYGLALSEGGIAYLFMYLLAPQLHVGWVIFTLLMVFIFMAKKNFKWSRLLYIYIFPW